MSVGAAAGTGCAATGAFAGAARGAAGGRRGRMNVRLLAAAGNPALVAEVGRFEARVVLVEGEFGVFEALVTFAHQIHFAGVFDSEFRDETGMAKGAVGHENTLAVRGSEHVLPIPF